MREALQLDPVAAPQHGPERSRMLSLVLTNYNHAHYLPEALEALAAQTRPADEAIFIDDASSDDSVAILEAYLPRFKNAQLVRNAKNRGVVPNMNVGLQMARGTAIHFAASDDRTYPAFFEKGMALLEAHPEAGLFSARSDVLDETGRWLGPLPTPVPLAKPGYIAPADVARFLLKDDGWFMGNASLFSRKGLLEAGGFPEALHAFTDGYTSRLLALKHGACFSPEVLCAWRRVEGGVSWSQAVNLEKTLNMIALVEEKMAAAGDTFPAGYAERWKGRHLFSTRRFGLIQERKRACAGGSLACLFARVREAVLTAWLFLQLRPQDLITVARRRLSQQMSVARGASAK
jgi:glycosyltransferase involved in cell wall biosynthesis